MSLVSWTIVKQGDGGPNVTSVQFLLRARGSGIAADGSFGPLTESAVKQFQTSRGLPADGVVGDATWPALVVTVSTGSTGDAVRAVQSRGLVLFPEQPPLVVDGSYGSADAERVSTFQGLWGLTVDGAAGVETWYFLVSGGRDDVWPRVKPGATDSSNFLVGPVQFLLRAHGSGIVADGTYGPATTTAVQRFQADNGVTADGIVDSQTWPKLIVTVGPGSTGDAVKAVQSCFPSLTVDGNFGPKTEAAVRDLQDVFLPPSDGIVGPNTWHLIAVPKSE
jgi:peptidoglycan hydrolase-like protein with peptidoglycan-binding domain